MPPFLVVGRCWLSTRSHSPTLATPNSRLPFFLSITNALSVLRLLWFRPKKSKSMDMRLDWLKERVSQHFLRLVFLPGLINPADFFTKILPVYRHLAALPFLHGTPYYPQTQNTSPTPNPPKPNHLTPDPVVGTQHATGTHLSFHHLSLHLQTSLHNLPSSLV